MSKDQEHSLDVLIRVFEASVKDVEPETTSGMLSYDSIHAKVKIIDHPSSRAGPILSLHGTLDHPGFPSIQRTVEDFSYILVNPNVQQCLSCPPSCRSNGQ